MADKLSNDDSNQNTSPSAGGKGFGGFSDLVSDVSKDIESAARESTSQPTYQPEATTSSTSGSQHTAAQADTPRAYSPSASPVSTGGSSGVKWFWGIAIGVLVLIVIGNSGKKESRPYTPSASYEPAPATIPDPVAPPAVAPTEVHQKEHRPPVGDGLVLSREQIRYCLSQKIRIDAIDKIANISRSGEVDSFNALVDDYNSRCSHFKYRQGSLEGVRAEVDGERADIEAAAQSSWLRESLGLVVPPKIATEPTPKKQKPHKRQDPSVVKSPSPQEAAEEAAKALKLQEAAQEAAKARKLQEAEQAEQARAQSEKIAASSSIVNEYKARILTRVKQKIKWPEEGRITAVYEVTLLPDGSVLESKLVTSSGNPAYDRQTKSAIEAAQPLPLPRADLNLFSQFRKIQLKFSPTE